MLMSCVYGAVLLRYVSLWGRRPCRPGVPILVKKPPRVAPTVSTRRAMLVYVALDSLESLDRDAHIKLCFNLDIANSRQLPGSARGALQLGFHSLGSARGALQLPTFSGESLFPACIHMGRTRTTADRRFFFSFLRRGAPEQLFRLVAFFLWYHKSDRSRGIVRIVYMLFGEAMLPLGYASCIYM